MLKELLDRTLEFYKPNEIITQDIDGRLYTRHPLNMLPKPEEYHPDKLTFFSLSALVQLAKIEALLNPVLTIDSHAQVSLRSAMQPQNKNARFCYAEAKLNFSMFQFGHWMDLENFVINLQSCFVQDDSVSAILTMLSHLHNETVQENKDDGFTQSLNIRTGITTKAKVQVENPVTLRPYRTFPEIDQPEGQFIIRFKNDGKGISCVLFEAGGGLWKIDAITSIAAFLSENCEIPVIA